MCDTLRSHGGNGQYKIDLPEQYIFKRNQSEYLGSLWRLNW